MKDCYKNKIQMLAKTMASYFPMWQFDPDEAAHFHSTQYNGSIDYSSTHNV